VWGEGGVYHVFDRLCEIHSTDLEMKCICFSSLCQLSRLLIALMDRERVCVFVCVCDAGRLIEMSLYSE